MEYEKKIRKWRIYRAASAILIITQAVLMAVHNYHWYNSNNPKGSKVIFNRYIVNSLLFSSAMLKLINDIMVFWVLIRSINYLFRKYEQKHRGKNTHHNRWRKIVFVFIGMQIFDQLTVVFTRVMLLTWLDSVFSVASITIIF